MTELEKRKSDFFSELASHDAWDSEFTANPYSPYRSMEKLAELGEEALPFFIEICRGSKGSWDDRLYGIHGIECLGERAGPTGLAALEALIGADYAGKCAAVAIERVMPERFWELKLHTNTEAVESLTEKHRDEGTGATWIARILALGDEKNSAAALNSLRDVKAGERELILELRKALMSPFATVRATASRLLANAPSASPVEALIESMATSGMVSVEPVAWHPDSVVLAPVLAQRKNLAYLGSLLERRRCAGLTTPPEPLIDVIDQTLRFPKREWRYEQHDVHDAATCARELNHEALIPALVEAVMPLNTGYAWNPLVDSFRVLGAKGRAALELAKKSADSERRKTIDGMFEALSRNWLQLEFCDSQFVDGSIDHTTGGAFALYSSVLRRGPSAHAAFQLAWIDRAFGATILPARIAWIRSMGFRDEELVQELATQVAPLEGYRFSWRKCEKADAERVAAAGLPGLAFSGSRDPAHTQAAKAHVARVKAACS